MRTDNFICSLSYLLILQMTVVSIVPTQRPFIFPKVRLSACEFGNRKYDSICHGKNTTISDLEIPKTFRQLEFTCSASYPIEWVFGKSLVDENNIISVNITKSRISEDSKDSFESVLSLKFKYSTEIPNFACNSVASILEIQSGGTEGDDYSHAPSKFMDKYYSTNISQISTDHSIILKITSKLPSNRRKEHRKNNPSALCKYQVQFIEDGNIFRCASPDKSSFLPVQFISSASLDESNQIFSPDAYSCSQYDSIDRTTMDNLRNFTGSGIIACGREPTFFVKHYYFPFHRETEVYSNVHYPENNLTSAIVDVSDNPDEIFKGQKVEFSCRVPSFFFSKGILWSSPSSNFSDDFSTVSLNDSKTEYYEQGAIVSKIIMLVSANSPLESVNLTCHAPVANSIAWVNKSLEIHLKDGLAPTDPSISIDVIYKGENSYTKATCKSNGRPEPQFVWIIEGLNMTALAIPISKSLQKKHDCKLILNCLELKHDDSTSVLKIERMGSDKDWRVHKLNYTCVAKNIFGEKQTTKFRAVFSNFHVMIIVITFGFILVLVLIVVLAYCKLKSIQQLTDAEVEKFLNGEPSSKDPTLWPYDTQYEIPRNEFQIADTLLGKGISGVVKIGRYGSKTIAVKTTKTPKDYDHFQSLLKELKMLCYLGQHENIINLIGACTENIRKREVYILLEFCSNGSVLEYIKGMRHNFIDRYTEEARVSFVMYQNGRNKNLTTRDLLRWAAEIADGCSFLSARKVIHGDLAARNVLITDSLLAKVGDFGLSKELKNYSIYVRQNNCPLPLKWMAIECLQDFEFSTESDVWAYGVTLWELFSLGDVPYPGLDWNYESYKQLKDGYRMAKPKYANNKTYDIMKMCWNDKPKTRPSFSYLREFFHDERNRL